MTEFTKSELKIAKIFMDDLIGRAKKERWAFEPGKAQIIFDALDTIERDLQITKMEGMPSVIYAGYYHKMGAEQATDGWNIHRHGIKYIREGSNWITDLSAVPMDRTILVKNDLGEVCPMCEGIIQNSPIDKWTYGQKITGWQYLPSAELSQYER